MTTYTPEVWKAVVGFEGRYEVSDLGRVYSHLTRKVLQPKPMKRCGHVQVMFRRRWYRVHCLVLEAFVGPRPTPKHEARHGNGVAWENNLGNLSWALKKHNVEDRKWHRLPKNFKLRPADVITIRQRLRNGERVGDVASDLGLHRNTVSKIKHRNLHADV